MNGMLPKNLRVPAPADPEVSEDFRELLEKVIEQNDEVLRRLDDKPKSTAPQPKPTATGFAAFWDAAFSLWGVLIAAIIAGMLIRIFGN